MHLIVLTLIFWLLIHLKYCLERVPWRSPTLLRVDFFFVSTLYIKKIIFIFSSLNCFTTFLEINWSYSMGLFLLFPFPPIIHSYICSLLSSQLWRLAVQDWVLLSIQPLTP